jgi:predicted DNA-binding transcriptional regulator YafY
MMNEDPDNPRYMPTHRFEQITILDNPVREPKDFNLDDFVHTNNLSFEFSKDLYTFKALFDFTAAAHLLETPLNSTQQVKRQADGRLLISARMTDTLQFEQWLKSFGSDVEVLAPKKLRNKFKKLSLELIKKYS